MGHEKSTFVALVCARCRQFLPELRKRFPKTEVIPIDKLDLNQAGLAKP
jgi:hypothetical protein